MRRGSVSTFDTVERRRSAGIVSLEQRNHSRQEFTVNDIDEEETGGCYISYRSIAFVFVFFLALIVAAAFIGVYIGTPPENPLVDAYNVLNQDDIVKEKYILASSIKPVRYEVKLEAVPGGGDKTPRVRIKGDVSIQLVQSGLEEPTQIVLNSKGLDFRTTRLIYNSTRPKRDAQQEVVNTTSDQSAVQMDSNVSMDVKISSNKTDATEGVYVIILEKPLKNGTYWLEIAYEATVNDNVINVENFTKNYENRLLMISKLKPSNARKIFPTLDDVRQKATFQLTLIHPNASSVLSNEPMLLSESDENTTSTTFEETRPMSAHDLAFVISSPNYIVQISDPDPSQPGVVYWGETEGRDQELYLKDKVGLAMAEYEEMFNNISRPTDKLDLVALPVDYDGISSPGLIITRETLFYVSAESAALIKTRALLNIMGLLGQQWLGGLVEARNWTDAWYLEGSVLYLPYVMLEKVEKNLKNPGDFLVDVQLDIMENDGYKTTKALDASIDPNRIEAFDLEDIYRKGACLISMMHASINETVFRNGYAEFLRRMSYWNADSEEFLKIVAGNVTIGEDTATTKSLDSAIRGWARIPGYPLINVTWHRENGTIVLTQKKFNFDELSNENEGPSLKEHWWVPLTYVTKNDDWTKPKTSWLKGEEQMTLDDVGKGSGNDSWIFFNVNRQGYYRVNYDELSWRALSSALSRSHSDIPPGSRASLIDDALSLARQGSLEYELALGMLEYLGPHERDYAPWRAVNRHVQLLDFALYETPVYPKFREFMRKLVAPLFDEVEQKINQGSPLVMLAVQLACTYEHPKCKSWAKTKWEQLLKSSTENMLLKHIREPVYCYGAQHGGQEELTYLMKKIVETNDREEKNRLLSALGCFQPPWILRQVLTEILKEGSYEDADIKVILKAYTKNPAAAQEARRFVLENWNDIVGRFKVSYWTMKSFVEVSTSLLFTEFDLNEFNTFRDANIDALKELGHGRVVILNEMKAISWIYRLKESRNSIERWFNRQTSVVA